MPKNKIKNILNKKVDKVLFKVARPIILRVATKKLMRQTGASKKLVLKELKSSLDRKFK